MASTTSAETPGRLTPITDQADVSVSLCCECVALQHAGLRGAQHLLSLRHTLVTCTALLLTAGCQCNDSGAFVAGACAMQTGAGQWALAWTLEE